MKLNINLGNWDIEKTAFYARYKVLLKKEKNERKQPTNENKEKSVKTETVSKKKCHITGYSKFVIKKSFTAKTLYSKTVATDLFTFSPTTFSQTDFHISPPLFHSIKNSLDFIMNGFWTNSSENVPLPKPIALYRIHTWLDPSVTNRSWRHGI